MKKDVNKPVIGVIKRKESNFLDIYIDTINYLNGDTKVIDNTLSKKEIFNQLLSCDGVLFTGGTTWERVDEDILKYCLDEKIPFLGICLGMQMIGDYFSSNHEYGVDKTVLINSSLCHNVKVDYAHKVLLRDGMLSRLFKSNQIYVNSYHNYCVNYTDDSIIKGYSEDGIIEAVEISNHPFGIGVQWHPEKMIHYDENSRILFKEFIESCK